MVQSKEAERTIKSKMAVVVSPEDAADDADDQPDIQATRPLRRRCLYPGPAIRSGPSSTISALARRMRRFSRLIPR